MSFVLDVPALLGDQSPRLRSVPSADFSLGSDAVELAAMAGLHLDPWQARVLEGGLGRRAGKWSAFEVCLIVARQNGKGAILEALELAALFLCDDVRLILHSAHEFKTAAEAFLRIRSLVEGSPQFSRRVERIRTAAGAEAIELKDGKRLRFVARSGGSGRGFSSDLVILDEAYQLGGTQMAALLPTLSARPDPQVWYTSSAGFPTSEQLGLVRSRGVAGGDPSLAFFEWSADEKSYDPADPAAWAVANPGLGIRISPDYVEKERLAMPPDEFARERLSVGDYPSPGGGWETIGKDAWESCATPGGLL